MYICFMLLQHQVYPYVVRSDDFDCGIMISGNAISPYYDNGIKVINGKGEKLEEEVIEKIESYIDGTADAIPLQQRKISEER